MKGGGVEGRGEGGMREGGRGEGGMRGGGRGVTCTMHVTRLGCWW
jgi:hypothetical protein